MSQLLLDSPAALSDFQLHLHDANLENQYSPATSSTTPDIPPKKGGRFSREAIRILKTWLNTHGNRPYPRPDDVLFLQQQTGLDGKQITTWFANARRRGHGRSHHVRSPQTVSNAASPIDIVARPGTPAVQLGAQHKDPMQRWVDSPPEYEAASFGDIARAVATESEYSNDEGYHLAAPGSSSSASSAGTCYSNPQSDCTSSGSQRSFTLGRTPRRRRLKKTRRPRRASGVVDLPFQCTFCVETFKTKYDWQRHEKALHLSLEQWTCAPQGARVPVFAGAVQVCCVFCGALEPDDVHLETHQYSACQARDAGERSFYRKDHLVQHLKLVHRVDTKHVLLDQWKTSGLDIRSRCGFCTLVMSTWTERVDHLADHFKAGATMAQWQGDWGFEDDVLQRVEDSVPPYFIQLEKNTPWPLRASDTPTATPVNAYELLTLELDFFRQTHLDSHGVPPTDTALQFEACRIVFASDALSDAAPSARDTPASWLRDLIMANPGVTSAALFGPLRTSAEGVSTLRIYGRTNLFEQCGLEAQLQAFVFANADKAGVRDWELQREACAIIQRTAGSDFLDGFAAWACRAVGGGTEWLGGFRQRMGLSLGNPSSSSFAHPGEIVGYAPAPALPPPSPSPQPPLSTPTPTLTSQTHRSLGPNFFRLFTGDLRRWVQATMSASNPDCHVPSDAEIQHHARWIMYESDDPWNQTAADYGEWLERFKRDVGIWEGGGVE